jgi:hypothetical protein
MSHELRYEVQSPAARWRAWSWRITELIDRRLADARAHAERGRFTDANARLLELRTGLVGRRPGDSTGLVRGGQGPFLHRTSAPDPDGFEPSLSVDDTDQPAVHEVYPGTVPSNGRNAWLEAIQLTAQAISDLARVSAASRAHRLPGTHSAALTAWETRHRDRIRRWAQRTLVDRGLAGSSRAERSP